VKWIRLIDRPDSSTLHYGKRVDIELDKFETWDVLVKCRESDITRLDEMGIKWETPTK